MERTIGRVALLSRRRLLGVAGLTLAAGCSAVATQIRAQPASGCSVVIPRKSSQQDARFIAVAPSTRRCGSCRFYQAPDHCMVVEGLVGADSVCNLWALRGVALGCAPDGPVRL
ncbi:hypothetical protein [Rhodopseudomonas sp. BR0M22]|uniref:hypothetical protein n=1 Tax=Rhodopseudomonas sp. BR0M22 TaxID=2269369 RepID=UPI0013E0689C|nr:hypothetical protein [Rhodopseudomonas sp. BR0M22]NEW91784.1 hypothetical protein [Rhodopseudomonas sp. BR0M22]